MLIAELPRHKSKIETATQNNNVTELRHAVHKLHGGAKYCAAEALSTSAARLETLIIENKTSRINSAIEHLYKDIEELIIYYKSRSN
ncbi:MAG: Hpt domain-containing protein [Gammaproteobacteria bacterium]|nr:Hpt domain-containing protein [Gammaproteobacteria bacterium]